MAEKIPTDRSNPSFEDHVSNLTKKYNGASDETKIGGHRWYRQAASDINNAMMVGQTGKDIATAAKTGQHPADVSGHWGHVPGTLDRDTSGGEQGARMGATTYTNNPKSAKAQTGLPFKGMREISNEAENSHILSAKQHGGMGAALDAAQGGLPQSRPSDAPKGSYLAKQAGGPKPGSAEHNAIHAVAAMSPAGATGMTWNDNVRATSELSRMKPSQVEDMRGVTKMPTDSKADAEKWGDNPPAGSRTAESDRVRGSYLRGKGITHAGLQSVTKGWDAMHGSLEPNKQGNLLGNTKTQHFANDIMRGTDQNDTAMASMPHGTVDKHQADAISGVRAKWSTSKAETGRTGGGRADLTSQLAEQHMPSLSKDKGYAYSRDVVAEAASRLSEQHGRTILPEHVQATSWGQQKMESDSGKTNASQVRDRARGQLADEATRTPGNLGKQFG